MNETVFDRIEKKYIISPEEKEILLEAIKKHAKKDNYHKSEVLNIYFDNDNFDLITQSIDWVGFKEKIRARSYGGYDRVFLEIKTKIKEGEDNIGYKRRVMITKKDYKKFVQKKANLEELAKKVIEKENDLQIAKEVDYLIKTLNLIPKILVRYSRESYKDESGVRITFDTNLKYRTEDLNFTKKKTDQDFFKEGENVIMEIKACGVIPLWLVKKLSELKIYPRQFSKIGMVYRKEKNV